MTIVQALKGSDGGQNLLSLRINNKLLKFLLKSVPSSQKDDESVISHKGISLGYI